MTFCDREFNPFLCWGCKGNVDTSLGDCVCWWSILNMWSSKGGLGGSRNKVLPSDLEGADVDMWSSISWPERVRKEPRGQGEGWLWEDSYVLGEGCCLDQETRGSEQSLVL